MVRVHQVLRGRNEPRHFLLTQYYGLPPLTLGERNVIGKIRPSKCLDEEKTQSSGTTFDRPRRELAVAKQVNLVLANMFWAEAIGRTTAANSCLRCIFEHSSSRRADSFPQQPKHDDLVELGQRLPALSYKFAEFRAAS
jgi:hypothetical protein